VIEASDRRSRQAASLSESRRLADSNRCKRHKAANQENPANSVLEQAGALERSSAPAQDGGRGPGGPAATSSPRPGDTRGDGPAAASRPDRPAVAATAGDARTQSCSGLASGPPAPSTGGKGVGGTAGLLVAVPPAAAPLPEKQRDKFGGAL
jgi:hypothetical protein